MRRGAEAKEVCAAGEIVRKIPRVKEAHEKPSLNYAKLDPDKLERIVLGN